MAEVARDVEAGILEPECAGAAEMYPESLLRTTDSALEAFEAEVRGLLEPTDDEILGAVERVVLALNAVDGDASHDGAGYCTEEREQLCEYIDLTLGEHGGRGCSGSEEGHRSCRDHGGLARLVTTVS